MNLPESLLAYLILHSLVQDDGVDGFIDVMPDSPDKCTAIFEYASYRLEGLAYERRFQIETRDVSAELARAQALAIANLLDMLEPGAGTVLSDRIVPITLLDSPTQLKVDERNRVYYSFNIQIIAMMD